VQSHLPATFNLRRSQSIFGTHQHAKKLIEISLPAVSVIFAIPRSTFFNNTPVHDKGTSMTIRIGDIAPDFTAETTEGTIKFHDWIGNKWAILFSHPKDFTPICTTELGYMAGLKPEFDKRNTKIIGLRICK
jgi:hypothetical protein